MFAVFAMTYGELLALFVTAFSLANAFELAFAFARTGANVMFFGSHKSMTLV
jgi:hypothetical protein